MKYIRKELCIPISRIVLYGNGEGCYPAIYLSYKIQKEQLKTLKSHIAGMILCNCRTTEIGGEVKIFSDEQKLRQLCTTKSPSKAS